MFTLIYIVLAVLICRWNETECEIFENDLLSSKQCDNLILCFNGVQFRASPHTSSTTYFKQPRMVWWIKYHQVVDVRTTSLEQWNGVPRCVNQCKTRHYLYYRRIKSIVSHGEQELLPQFLVTGGSLFPVPCGCS